MSTMDYAASRFRERKHHMLTTAALVVGFWAGGASLVLNAEKLLAPMSWGLGFAIRAAAIIVVAFAYINLTARRASTEHAFIVGLLWSVFTVLTEMTQTVTSERGWFALLGSPADPTLRYLLLFLWIGAPALFAHARTFEEEGQ